jgi:hypothetical protein
MMTKPESFRHIEKQASCQNCRLQDWDMFTDKWGVIIYDRCICTKHSFLIGHWSALDETICDDYIRDKSKQ